MKERFGKQHFYVLYCFITEIIDLPISFELTLRSFNMEEREIKKRMLFFKLMETTNPKWTTNEFPVIVDCVNYIFNMSFKYRVEINQCLFEIDKRMKKDDNYMWNRRNLFTVRKILDNITNGTGDYIIDFEDWDGHFVNICYVK